MQYKHKITGNIAELSNSGKNYKVSHPQNFTIPAWIIENSNDWEPINKRYPIEFKDLKGGEYYTTEFTYSNQRTEKYSFVFGKSIWFNHSDKKIHEVNSDFHPGNGFYNFRLANLNEKLLLVETELGFRVLEMKISDKVNLLKASRQINGTFQSYPLDTKDVGGSTFEEMILSGWVISKVKNRVTELELESGDEVSYDNKIFNIIEFFLYKNHIYAVGFIKDCGVLIQAPVNLCKKEKITLFVTDDNVKLSKNENYFAITQDYRIISATADTKELPDSYIKSFKNKLLAEDYLVRNKPLLSLVDISKVYTTANSWDPRTPEINRKQPKDLYLMAKEKLD